MAERISGELHAPMSAAPGHFGQQVRDWSGPIRRFGASFRHFFGGDGDFGEGEREILATRRHIPRRVNENCGHDFGNRAPVSQFDLARMSFPSRVSRRTRRASGETPCTFGRTLFQARLHARRAPAHGQLL